MAKKTVINQPVWWKSSWDRLFFLLTLSLFVLLMPGANVYTVKPDDVSEVVAMSQLPIPTPAPLPLNIINVYPGQEISAQGVVILDVDSGVTMYARNEYSLFSPASTTKIMTALVALELFDLDEVVTVTTVVSEGQTMGLFQGEQITVENLLYGALIQSGNDAAYALADHDKDGVDAFVTRMNEKAREIGLTQTSFTNPVGYDGPNHKTTPVDLAQLARYALTNKTIAKIVAIPQITISDVNHGSFHVLQNVNQLLGKIPGVGGIKTGWTEEAGENLVTLVTRNGHSVVIVVLKSEDRFGDTAALIDWIFSSYEWRSLAPEV